MLIVLAVLATFALLFFNPSPTTGGASQRYLMAGVFSLVTVFLIPNAPAGIAVYFIASGVWQMMQQARDPLRLAAALGADTGGGAGHQAAATSSAEAQAATLVRRPRA